VIAFFLRMDFRLPQRPGDEKNSAVRAVPAEVMPENTTIPRRPRRVAGAQHSYQAVHLDQSLRWRSSSNQHAPSGAVPDDELLDRRFIIHRRGAVARVRVMASLSTGAPNRIAFRPRSAEIVATRSGESGRLPSPSVC